MTAVLLALLSGGLWGSADFFGGLLSRRLPAYAVVGSTQAAGLMATTAVVLGTGSFRGDTGWLPWAALAGVSGAVGLVCFYAALATGTMGVVSPIAAMGAGVPVLIALLGGEEPSALAGAGVVLALIRAVGASGPELRGATGTRPVLLAAIAALAFGLALTFLARGAASSALMTLWGMRTTSVLAFTVAALTVGTIGGLRVSDLRAVTLVGVADAGANLLFAVATQRGYLSLTSVLASLYPVVTVLLARVVLRERLTRVQQVGVLVALGGVALISLG